MKSLLLSLASAVVLVFSLSSCVPLDDPYFAGGGGGYNGISSGYSRSYSDYGSSSPRYYEDDSIYGSRDYGQYGYGRSQPRSYYSSGYGHTSSVRVCNTCHHNPCTCRHHVEEHYNRNYSRNFSDNDHHDGGHVSGGHSSSHSGGGAQKYEYHGSVGRGDSKPEGNHSRDWYKEHGYSLKNLRPSH